MKTNTNAFLVAIACLVNSQAFAQGSEGRTSLATDASEKHILTENPAIGETKKLGLSYIQSLNTDDYKYKLADRGGDETSDVHQKNKETRSAAGILAPLGGGSAAGLSASQTKTNYESEFDARGDKLKESMALTQAMGRLVLGINETTQAAFAIRYAAVKADLLGDIFVGDGERTNYKGSMTGFSGGIFYRGQDFSLGLGYLSPLRGKIKVGDEEFIATERGVIVVDGIMGHKNDIRYGASIHKWLYKADDRSEIHESTETGRDISLNGLDLEQWMKPTQEIAVGVDSSPYGALIGRLSLSMITGVWQFEPGSVPNDGSPQTKFTTYAVKLAGAYDKPPFFFQIGYQMTRKATTDIDGSFERGGNWFASKYEDYKGVDSGLFLTITYTN